MINTNMFFGRINVFLSSNDLTNTPLSHGIYEQYCVLCKEILERLVGCNELLQDGKNYEAVTLAHKVPDLFDLVESFRKIDIKTFLDLCDLYDWDLPYAINDELYNKIKAVSLESEKLTPLLTEYRRIARADSPAEKMKLLRLINKLDPQNIEWANAIREVEIVYLKDLFSEAQECIQTSSLERLCEIKDELEHESWHVSIPSVVEEKIGKIVEKYKQEQAVTLSKELMVGIDAAFCAKNIQQLEVLVSQWCSLQVSHGYMPSDCEKEKFKTVNTFLEQERAKDAVMKRFNAALAKVSNLLNERKELDKVETAYAAVLSFKMQIPDFISKRVLQYRKDVERARRRTTFIKVFRISTISGVFLLLLAVAGVITYSYYSVKGNEELLISAIKENKLVEARKILNKYEKDFPLLAKKASKITAQRVALEKLESDERKHKAEFEKKVSEITQQLQKNDFDESKAKQMLEALKKIAKNSDEKKCCEDFESRLSTRIQEEKASADAFFDKKIKELKKLADEFGRRIASEQFTEAETLLTQYDQIYTSIKENERLKNEKAISPSDVLRKQLKEAQEEVVFIRKTYDDAVNASDFENLRNVIEHFDDKACEDKELKQLINNLKVECNILSILCTKQSDIPNNLLLKQDIQRYKSEEKSLVKACGCIKDALASFHARFDREQVYQLSFKNGAEKVFSVFTKERVASKSAVGDDLSYSFKDIEHNKVNIQTKKGSKRFTVDTIGGSDLRLIYPTIFDYKNPLKKAVAAHQKLAERLYVKSRTYSTEAEDLFYEANSDIQKIINDEFSAPYWKMRLCLAYLASLDKIEMGQEKALLTSYKKELESIVNDIDENEWTDAGLNKTFLTELNKINIAKLFSLGKTFSLNHRILNEYLQTRYCFLGVSYFDNKELQFRKNPRINVKDVDVLCLDSKLQKLVIVGKFDGQKLIIAKDCRAFVSGKILLFSPNAQEIKSKIENLKRNIERVEPNSIHLPISWPTLYNAMED